ncbi:helix-turn-helix transcriptional regulator [Paenibacillus eucommiae]|uniref:DNA-binding CsgD family transcriptional regulator n=1 Tax=Paenibacillus eucommiae TaxID=1355755 RepID=A0ABS4IRF1_9BACL|nr:LuxR family transcriptional regulator [Paenibacillus eucommiae]MBP1989174.1 DNA-binding CsgD family transcriptional regulator [Paenibacillus eucommiae]
MSTVDPHSRLASEIDHLEQHFLVGREKEVLFFLERLKAEQPSEARIVNIYGTGGVGKSFLLGEFRRLAVHAHISFLLVDCRVTPRNPPEFCLHLLRALRYPVHRLGKKQMQIGILTEICLEALQKTTAQGKVVLAFDTFEEIGELEHWLRDEILAYLNSDILVIISGRFPLQGTWRSSPAWRQFIHRLPLAELEYDAVKQYLLRSGIERQEMIHHIWSQTKGHPLTLSLLVSTTLKQALQKSAKTDEGEVFAQVVNTWLKEVPDPDMRELVEGAAVLRHFNQELLSFVLEKQVTTDQFLKLTRYSFVQRVDRGWLLHDLLRDAIGNEMQMRAPEYFDRLWKRCILHYYRMIKQSVKEKSAFRESTEWVYYIANQLIRSLFYPKFFLYSSEPLNAMNWVEAEQYMHNRLLTAKETRIVHTNRDTNESIEYVITVEENLYGLKHIDLQELYDLDPSIVKLIRNDQGAVCGLTAIIPIQAHTLDYLLTKPLSSAYFSHLPEAKMKELRVPKPSVAGYFVKTLDVYDFGDISMMQASGLAFINHMMLAGYVVAAPPPLPLSHAILQSLGCEKVKDVVHYDYDGRTPTPLFFIDTRGNKLHDYLNRMVDSFGIVDGLEEDDANDALNRLTKREKNVAELVMQGCSNLEIAKNLYLSETTVKKHITHIYRKLDVKNRMQLINKQTK